MVKVAPFRTKFDEVSPKVAPLLFVIVPPVIETEVLPFIVPLLVTVPPWMRRFAPEWRVPWLVTVPVKIAQSVVEEKVPWFVIVMLLEPPPRVAVELEVIVPEFVKAVGPAPPPTEMLAALTVDEAALVKVADPRFPVTPASENAPVKVMVPLFCSVLPWMERLGGLIVPWLMRVPPEPAAPSKRFSVGVVEVMEEAGPSVRVPPLKRKEALEAFVVGLKIIGALIVWLPPNTSIFGTEPDGLESRVMVLFVKGDRV